MAKSTEFNLEKSTDALKRMAALKCAIIGIGNAGNQVVGEAYKNGFEDVFAINSSQADLVNAGLSNSIPSFILGNEARGAGKNRQVALSLLKDNGRELLTEITTFTKMLADNEIIVVCGSTAGGTGSGVAPYILKAIQLQYPNKIIIYIGILPRMTDSVRAQSNSIECMDEIQKLNIPFLLVDLEHYADVPNDIAYTEVQKYVTECINIIKGKYLMKSSYGMIDENDMRMLVAEPGYLSIYKLDKITQTQLDNQTMQSMMTAQIKKSPAAEIMRDGIVKQMAVILNMPEELSDSSKTSNYDELTNYIGRPLTIFENYAIINQTNGQMIVILSGQTAPYARLSRMADIVNESRAIYDKQRTFSLEDMLEGGGIQKGNTIPSFLNKEKADHDKNVEKITDFFDSL